LIEDLLDMSRIISGKVRLEIRQIDPVSFIGAAMDTVMPAAAARGIALSQSIDPGMGSIAGDTNRLQQVVWNLLSNAIKFTPPGGRVQVNLQRFEHQVRISVSDSGQGIKPEFLPHVFERFRQADASTTRSHGGLGLGLAIVKQLVELHGGTISATSAGAGQGSTFTFTLPVFVSREPITELKLTSREPLPGAFDCNPQTLTGTTVLVVDDEPDARGLVKRVLEECGATVVATESAAEAVRMVPSVKPDVLVSDIGMPGMDGYELIRRVRALGAAQGGNVPAIALTAFARSEDRTRALLAGYRVHVAKPVEPHELIATVATVAGHATTGVEEVQTN
jgi:CheY-like chemotaxis protein